MDDCTSDSCECTHRISNNFTAYDLVLFLLKILGNFVDFHCVLSVIFTVYIFIILERSSAFWFQFWSTRHNFWVQRWMPVQCKGLLESLGTKGNCVSGYFLNKYFLLYYSFLNSWFRYATEIFMTNKRGWAVRAVEAIPAGAFVCEYAGEILPANVADDRDDDSYLFEMLAVW